MAKLSGQKLYLGSTNLSTLAYDLSLSFGKETHPDADFADTTAVVQAGLKTAAASGKARYTTGATGLDTLLSGTQGTLLGPVSFIMGTAEGNTCFTIDALQTNYRTAEGAAGDMHQVGWAVVPGGECFIGKLLTSQTAATTGNSTGLDLGVLATGYRLYSALHVDVGSGGNLTVLVESDVTGWASATTRITHTVATAATSELLSLAGPVATDDLWRSQYTISAGTFNFVHIIAMVEDK